MKVVVEFEFGGVDDPLMEARVRGLMAELAMNGILENAVEGAMEHAEESGELFGIEDVELESIEVLP